jgi:hypothetical protein
MSSSFVTSWEPWGHRLWSEGSRTCKVSFRIPRALGRERVGSRTSPSSHSTGRGISRESGPAGGGSGPLRDGSMPASTSRVVDIPAQPFPSPGPPSERVPARFDYLSLPPSFPQIASVGRAPTSLFCSQCLSSRSSSRVPYYFSAFPWSSRTGQSRGGVDVCHAGSRAPPIKSKRSSVGIRVCNLVHRTALRTLHVAWDTWDWTHLRGQPPVLVLIEEDRKRPAGEHGGSRLSASGHPPESNELRRVTLGFTGGRPPLPHVGPSCGGSC